MEFGGIDKIELFRKQLRCKNIILILGNHDYHILRNKNNVRKYFKDVFNSFFLTINDKTFHLIHNPIELQLFFSTESYALHGHFHSIGNDRLNNNKLKHRENTNHTFFDVGMIGHPEFRPYSIDEIKTLLNL